MGRLSENMLLKPPNILGFSKGKWSTWWAELVGKEADEYGWGGGWLTSTVEIVPVADPEAD